jgi:hypothetical protein
MPESLWGIPPQATGLGRGPAETMFALFTALPALPKPVVNEATGGTSVLTSPEARN